MRVLAHFHSDDAAYKTQQRLEKAGVPVIVEFRHTLMSKGLGSPYTLSVALDEQYNDAVQLISNPNHLVANPIDVENFKRYTENGQAHSLVIPKILNTGLLLALGLFAIMAVIFLFESSH